MPKKARRLYWDSNVFLDYINANPANVNTIASLLHEIEKNDDDIILTSVLSKVEVAFAAYEKTQGALDPQVEADIDALWEDPSVIELIDLNDDITLKARSLLREALKRGWARLTPRDAIHLASAQWVQVIDEFHTGDEDLDKYSALIGCRICRPHILQPRLIE